MYEIFEFLHGAPYAICVELKYFYVLSFVLEVFCLFCLLFWRYFVCFVCDIVRGVDLR